MKMAKSFFAAILVLGAIITTASTAVYASSWNRWTDSTELYGLPHVVTVHSDKRIGQLDFGSDGYGLPMATKGHAVKSFDKIDFSADLYGLPYSGNFHKM